MAVEARIKKQIKNNHKYVCSMFMNNNKHSAHTYKQMYEPLLPDIYLFATTVNFNVQLLSATEQSISIGLGLRNATKLWSLLCKNCLVHNGILIEKI